MKKKILLVLCFYWSFSTAQFIQKERYTFGWKFGYTMHTITGGRIKTHPKDYFEGGFWLRLKLDKKWTIQTEIFFVEKGTGGGSHEHPTYGDYWVGLYYLEVPILFQYHVKRFLFELGPGLGVMTYGHENLHLSLQPDLADQYPFTKQEVSFNAGVVCYLNKKWSMGLRATHSLLPVRQQLPGISEQVYNRIIALTINRRLMLKKKKVEEGEAEK